MAILWFCGPRELEAQTAVWVGNSSNAFGTAANWVTAPSPGFVLEFDAAGSKGLLLNENLAAGFNIGGITFNGPGAFVIGDGTTTVDAGNAFTLTGDVTNNSTSLQTINDPFSLSGARTFTTTAGGGNISLGGNISDASGGGGIVVAGGGVVTLSGNNSYSEGTTVSQGTLVLNSNTAAGGYNAGAITLGNGATGNSNVELDFGSGISGADLTLPGVGGVRRVNPITVAHTGSSGTVTLGFTGATPIIYTDLALNAPVVFTSNSTTRLQRAYMGLISGAGAGAGNNSVIFNLGAGNWLDIYPKENASGVGSANTFTGNLLVQSGNLEVNGLTFNGDTAANQNLTIPATASVTVNSGAVLQFVWGDETFDALNGGGTIQRNTGDNQGTRNLTIGASGGSGSFSGTITSTFNLTKTGSGAEILSGANTYTGATTISGGSLQLGAGGATGSLSTSSTITDNATLVFDRSNTVTEGADFASAIGGSGSVVQEGSGTLILNGANTYSGGTTISSGALQLGNGLNTGSIAGNVTDNGTFVFDRGDDFTFGGVISGSGGVTQNGNILRFTAAQTYTGPTQVNNGFLVLPTTVDRGLSASTVVTIGSTGTLDLSNHNQTFAGLAGGGTVYSFGGSAGSLTLNVAPGQTDTFSGVLGGNSLPNFSLTLSGPGTEILAGANIYSGATTVNAGTLALAFGSGVSANILPSTSALVLGGGTLTLTGTGAQVVNGLTTPASTGSSIVLGGNETLTLGALTSAGAGSALNFNVAAGGANAGISYLGTGTVVVTGFVTNPNFTVTDAGGFGLATVNGSNQVVRLTTIPLLPGNRSSTFDYLINNNASGASSPGSSSLAVTASESPNSITVDTSQRSGVLNLNSGVLLSSNTWNIGGNGTNTYLITGGTGGGGLSAVRPGNPLIFNATLTFNDYNTGQVTIASPIIDLPQQVVVSVVFNGSGTTILTANNTFTGGTTVTGGSLQIGDGTDPAALVSGQYPNGLNILTAVNVTDIATLTVLNHAVIAAGAGLDNPIFNSGSSGGNGGIGVSLSSGGALANSGSITGGAGGYGGDGLATSSTMGGPGGNGGLGVVFAAGGSVTNSGTIGGGSGGGGGIGAGGPIGGGPGGAAGSGASGLVFESRESMTNNGAITGGSGGSGGAGGPSGSGGFSGAGGAGGNGGSGLVFTAGGSVTNGSTISGGSGGTGGSAGDSISLGGDGGTGGSGVFFGAGGSVTNGGTISGGSGGASGGGSPIGISAGTGGSGVFFGAGGSVTNSGTISGNSGGAGNAFGANGGAGGSGVTFGAGGSVTNSGTISGNSGGTGGFEGVNGVAGTGAIFSNGAGTLINQNGGVINGGVSMDNYANSVTLQIGSTINGTLNINSNTSSTLLLTDNGTGGTQTYSAAVTGATTFAGSLTKTGTGTWTLDEAFTYTGPTTVSAGTLIVTGSLGNTAVTVASRAVLGWKSNNGAGGSLNFSNGSSLGLDVSTYGPLSVSGNLTLNGTVNVSLITAPLSVAPGQTIRLLNYGGTLTGSAANLTTSGFRNPVFSTATAGQVNLTFDTKALTWSGGTAAWDINMTANWDSGTDTFFQGDTVTFGDSGAIRAVALNAAVNPSAVTFSNSSGNAYAFSGTGSISGNVTQNGAGAVTIGLPIRGVGTVTQSGSGPLTLAGANTYTGTTNINAGTLSLTGTLSGGGAISTSGAGVLSESSTGGISGASSFTLGGTGTCVLAGANSYTGTTTINAGTLQIGNGGTTGALSSSSAITDNATLVFNRTDSVTEGGTIAGSGQVVQRGSGTLILTGSGTYAGGATISSGTLQIGIGAAAGSITGNVTDSGALVFDRSDDYTYAGVISGSGGLTQAGNTLRFSVAQTYAGPTQVNSGAFLVLPTTVGQGLAASTVVTVLAGGTLDLSNQPQTFAGLAGGGTVYSFNATSSLLTLQVAAGQSYTFSGSLGGSHPGFGLTKSGSGTETLSGSNPYTGATTISGGTLEVNGSIAASSLVSVSIGGTLGGHGSVSKISGAGLVAPGDPQILTATQIDPSGGLDFNFKLTLGAPNFATAAASGNDVLHLTNSTPFVFALTAANVITVDFSGATLAPGQTYFGGFFTDAPISNSLLSGASFAYTGLNGASVQYEGLAAVPSAAFATGTVSNGEVMEFLVVPEPRSAGLALLGGLVLLLRRRKR